MKQNSYDYKEELVDLLFLLSDRWEEEQQIQRALNQQEGRVHIVLPLKQKANEPIISVEKLPF